MFNKLLLVIVLCVSLNLNASDIDIIDVSSPLDGEYYLLESTIQFTLDEEVIEAVEHGVALYIDVIARIKRQRKWVWDKKVIERKYSYKLEKHALTNDYVVTNIESNTRNQLSSLDEALNVLGRISGQELVPAIALIENRGYTGQIRVELDVEALPPPLRPIAYTSGAWRLNSDWHKWDIRIVDEK